MHVFGGLSQADNSLVCGCALVTHLFEHDEGHDSLCGEESRNEDHDDADRDVDIQASQSRDPTTAHHNMLF